MANTWKPYAEGIKNLMNGNMIIGTDTFKCGLFTSDHTITQDTDSTYTNTNEVATGNGYTRNDKTVTISLSVDTTNNEVEIRCTDPIEWTNSSITARHAIIYKDGTTDYLLAYMTFGDGSPANVVSQNGTFSIDQDDSNGMILKFTY